LLSAEPLCGVARRSRFRLICTAWTNAADCRTINLRSIDGLEPGPMSGPLSAPSKKATNLRRVAILFAGGPAPAANAVISTAAAAFQRNDIEVVGIMHGYSHLAKYSPEQPL